ncbi:hypothetical protein JKG47_14905 [Acidithiobacillus sp. MC6.1]|nr:hypothetical protein [Acidithiobacillus sp. MC6.1]
MGVEPPWTGYRQKQTESQNPEPHNTHLDIGSRIHAMRIMQPSAIRRAHSKSVSLDDRNRIGALISRTA